MKNSDLPKLGFFFKGFPADVRFRRHTVPESLEIARGTLYETWYRCIKASPYMAEAESHLEYRSTWHEKTHLLFGDLQGTTFDSWWLDRGYRLFSEQTDFKKIAVQGTAGGSDDGQSLMLRIPLTVSPTTLRDQFDDLLRQHHPHYRNFDRWKYSTAQARLKSSRLSSVSLNLYMDVYEHWAANPKLQLYAIGEQLQLNPKLVVKRTDLSEVVKDKHLQMSLLVSEYLGKAKNLVAHASEGRFPCTDDHEWVERTTRAPNWRKRE